MIEFLGWAVFILGGAWLAGTMAFGMSMLVLSGGLETVGAGIFYAALAALGWLAFSVWLSPITISLT
jgi:hypothetical protein